MQLHMLSGLFHLSPEQCCSGVVFSLTLKTSWKALPGFVWRSKDRPEC